MTIGPEPMMRIFEMSVRLGIPSEPISEFGFRISDLGTRSSSVFPKSEIRNPNSEISFPFLHHVEEFREQIIRVVRTGRRFGVVLNAERWHGTMLKTLNGIVIQVDMRHFDIIQ